VSAQALYVGAYLHSALIRTDRERVVLFIDIKRPLQPPVNAINSALMKAVSEVAAVKRARAQHVAQEGAVPCRVKASSAVQRTAVPSTWPS
jgi:aspartyl/asparaginyl beta-hydroxylase (cupin superfamily)